MTLLACLTTLFITTANTPATESISIDYTFNLRVVTYNIHHAQGSDATIDLERIANIIEALNADVVCLQEVDQNVQRSHNKDIPSILAQRLDMNVVFGPNLDLDKGKYGNATLSKFPILSSENFSLPNPHDKEPRGCLSTQLQVPGSTYRLIAQNGNKRPTQKITVFNTHLGLEPQERFLQASFILDKAKDIKTPILLAGDLNESIDGKAMKLLFTHFQDSPFSMKSQNLQLDKTSPFHNTYSAQTPHKRIDYILKFGLECSLYEVYRYSNAWIASDHLPVVADFSLPTSK